MEYWYKYRSDLWKQVTIYSPRMDCAKRTKKHDPEEDGDARTGDKTGDNIRRAQRTIEAYALCNQWTWFGTFTLSPEYRDRTDLDGFRKDFMQFIRHNRRKYGDIDALLVPELHKKKDGWHMHGLLQGLPVEALRPFTLADKLPKYIRGKLKAGNPVYDWPAYRASFGWVDIEPLRSRDAAARYITKYITKATDSTAKALDLGKHLYYVTRGLDLPELVEVGNAPGWTPEALPCGLAVSRAYDFPPDVPKEEKFGVVRWYEPIAKKSSTFSAHRQDLSFDSVDSMGG